MTVTFETYNLDAGFWVECKATISNPRNVSKFFDWLLSNPSIRNIRVVR